MFTKILLMVLIIMFSFCGVCYSDVFNNITDFGATPNDSTDDTLAIQQAINASENDGYPLYIPKGIYNISKVGSDSCLFINKNIKIIGTGADSYLHSTSPDAHIIKVSTNDPVYMNDFTLIFAGSIQPNNGISCLYITAPSVNKKSRFNNLILGNGNTGVHFNRAAFWIMDGCFIENFYNYGIIVENLSNPDEGDSKFSKNYIIGRVGSTSGMLYKSGGGLNIVSNKVLGYQKYGLEIFADTGGNLHKGLNSWIINSNSIEGSGDYIHYGLYIHSKDAYPNTAVINGNEITGGIYMDGGADKAIFLISITGNTIGYHTMKASSAVTILNSDNIIVSGNVIRHPSNSYTKLQGNTNVVVEANCYNNGSDGDGDNDNEDNGGFFSCLTNRF